MSVTDDFVRVRPRLVRIAYAVLGSHADAEDVVSDCWPKLVAADATSPVLDVEAWAVVAVSRAALDVLRSARVRRETYVGPWLPEPLVGPADSPPDRVTLDESVRFALMVVLETLSPAERTTWVLHDVFDVPFDEIARVVGRTPNAVRQLASRARRHVTEGAPRFAVSPELHAGAVRDFTRAAGTGVLADLLTTLDPDVVLVSDGGGVVSAARRPVIGADHVARFLLGIAAKAGDGLRVRPCRVNGRTGLALVAGDGLVGVVSFEVSSTGLVSRIDMIRSPAKLALVDPSVWQDRPDS
ncbi:RNA polymerase sigma factor SigJ [Rhodococcus sp. NBC_00297]|uniref:RNA polymerase sigma factor SigJ n=1 Tax=Rhodococcus sp. NBC_00297 TaxID=2976005 RepID=UPI002E28FC3F|nr:RNA polymerase sigma factor SigJ [Rhodococcus sp. NBC_00297]